MESDLDEITQLRKEVERLKKELEIAQAQKHENIQPTQSIGQNNISKQGSFDVQDIQRLLPFAMKTAGLGLWSVDLISLSANWSPELCAILGINQQQFIKKNDNLFTVEKFLDYLHPNDKLKMQRRVQESIKHKKDFNEKFRMRHIQGHYKWLHSIGQTAYRSDGTPQHITGFVWDITEQVKMEQKLRQLSVTDALTGLHNRRRLMEILEQEVRLTQRFGKEVSIIVIDIDHFKKINDRFGHDMGDRFLIQLAKLMKQTFRSIDFLCRYGGEEFIVILPSTNASSALHAADRLRNAFSEAPIEGIHATLSAGVSSSRQLIEGDQFERLIELGDQALYTAKRNGRNAVCYAAVDEEILTKYDLSN